MLSLLPIITYLTLLAFLLHRGQQREWRLTALRSALITGVYASLSLEILSIFHGINRWTLACVWAAPAVVLLFILVRSPHRLRIPKFDRFLLSDVAWVGAAVMLILAAVLAGFAPVQTVDSQNYHVARVAHWAQNESVWHYATGVDKQNGFSPGAEMLLLHSYVLAQSDLGLNFVQWLSMLGGIIAVSLLAKQLGAGRQGQALAALFAATIPMMMVEASSTMNDAVLGFWILCAAVEALHLWRREDAPSSNLIFLSLAAGLAILTKPTSVVYLLPIGVFVLIILLKRLQRSRLLGWLLIVLLITIILNGGHWLRNTITYGDPLASAQFLSAHTNEAFGLRTVFSNLLRNAGMHASTPWSEINDRLTRLIYGGFFKLGVNPHDPQTTFSYYAGVQPISHSESLITNPVHALVILLCLILLGLRLRRIPSIVTIFSLLTVSTFILYSWLFKWQGFGSRLHLPFFLLAAPFVGALLGDHLRKIGRLAFTLIFLAVGLWNGLQIWPRLIISGETHAAQSIFQMTREDLVFLNGPNQAAYEAMTARILEAGCNQVGLMLSGNAGEYPLWILLDAPKEDLQMEWIVSGPTERYSFPGFDACAIICEACPEEWDTIRDLTPVYQDEGKRYRLFLEAAR